MRPLPAVLTCILLACPAGAHPWGGLAVDAAGTVYFTFVCPMDSDGHHACVYRLPANTSTPEPYLISAYDPSDLILVRTPGRAVYAAERVEGEPYRTRLWKLTGDEAPALVFDFAAEAQFSANPYAVDDEGRVFYVREGDFVMRDRITERASPYAAAFRKLARLDASVLRRARNLLVTEDGSLLVQYDADLALVGRNGEARLVAGSLRQKDPENLPFRGANILFDMARSEAGDVFLAYYGNGAILRVAPSGTVSTVLESGPGWSPSGVDVFEGTVYVLESTTPSSSLGPRLRARVRVLHRDGTVRVRYGS